MRLDTTEEVGEEVKKEAKHTDIEDERGKITMKESINWEEEIKTHKLEVEDEIRKKESYNKRRK